MKSKLRISTLLLMVAVSQVHASDIQNLVEFRPGAVAKASEVNGNFNAVAVAVTDNDARVTALNELVLALTARIEALEAQQSSNQAAIDFAKDLDVFVTVRNTTTEKAVVFSGANLRVNNGSGASRVADGGEKNGLGNVIIGYNELQAGNVRTGSHNLIIGPRHYYAGELGIAAGDANLINNVASAAIGFGNLADAETAVSLGGKDNLATGKYSAVVGGLSNHAAGLASAVLASHASQTTGFYSAVMGSQSSVADADNSGALFAIRSAARSVLSAITAVNGQQIRGHECAQTWSFNLDHMLDPNILTCTLEAN